MARDTDFFISQLSELHTDPVKSTMWRVIVPNSIWTALVENGYTITNFGDQFTQDDLKLHLQTVDRMVPPIGAITEEVSYFGIKKPFVTNVKPINGTIEIGCLMPEDMRAFQAITYWAQTIAKSGIISEDNPAQDNDREKLTGLSKGKNSVTETGNPTIINSDVRVQLYDFYAHEPIFTVNYINAMCVEVNAPGQLGYDTAKLQKFNFKLAYDRFIMTFNDRYK